MEDQNNEFSVTGFSWNGLLHTAMNAAKETSEDSFKLRVSIFFSVASVESFIHQLPEMCKFNSSNVQLSHPIKAVAGLFDESEDKISLKLQLNIIRAVLGISKTDWGASLYQKFDTLLDLRNKIAHTRVERSLRDSSGNVILIDKKEHKIWGNLRSWGLVNKLRAGLWTELMCDPVTSQQLAYWSCGICSNVIRDVENLLPDWSWRGELKRLLDNVDRELESV